jgi:tRNA-dihydrouridine synthase
MVTQTGCDAVMIGRMAPSNPWIFRQIEQYSGIVSGQPNPCHPEEPVFGDEGSMHFAGCAREADNGNSRELATHLYDHPTELDRYQMIRTYFQMLIEEELPDAIGKMKQFASWFTHGVPGGAALRKEIYESKSAPEVLGRVENFFEARLCIPVTTPDGSKLVAQTS